MHLENIRPLRLHILADLSHFTSNRDRHKVTIKSHQQQCGLNSSPLSPSGHPWHQRTSESSIHRKECLSATKKKLRDPAADQIQRSRTAPSTHRSIGLPSPSEAVSKHKCCPPRLHENCLQQQFNCADNRKSNTDFFKATPKAAGPSEARHPPRLPTISPTSPWSRLRASVIGA